MKIFAILCALALLMVTVFVNTVSSEHVAPGTAVGVAEYDEDETSAAGEDGNDGGRRIRRMQSNIGFCGQAFDCGGSAGATWCDAFDDTTLGCFCTKDTEGDRVCAQNAYCSTFDTCENSCDCKVGHSCVPNTCCPGDGNVCVPDCYNPDDDAITADGCVLDHYDDCQRGCSYEYGPFEDPNCYICRDYGFWDPVGSGCDQCYYGYSYLGDTREKCHKCSDMIPHCIDCDQYVGCTQCEYGYRQKWGWHPPCGAAICEPNPW